MGFHAMLALQKECPDLGGVTFKEGVISGFVMASPIEEADNIIIIDAARFDSVLGT